MTILQSLGIIAAAGLLGLGLGHLHDYLRYIRPSRRLRDRITAELAARDE